MSTIQKSQRSHRSTTRKSQRRHRSTTHASHSVVTGQWHASLSAAAWPTSHHDLEHPVLHLLSLHWVHQPATSSSSLVNYTHTCNCTICRNRCNDLVHPWFQLVVSCAVHVDGGEDVGHDARVADEGCSGARGLVAPDNLYVLRATRRRKHHVHHLKQSRSITYIYIYIYIYIAIICLYAKKWVTVLDGSIHYPNNKLVSLSLFQATKQQTCFTFTVLLLRYPKKLVEVIWW